MKNNLPIVIFPQGYETECEGVLLFIDSNHYAHVLNIENMTVYVGAEWQIKKTSYTCPVEYIEISEAA